MKKKEFEPKGYNVVGGFFGVMPDGQYKTFKSEEDYLEAVKEAKKKRKK